VRGALRAGDLVTAAATKWDLPHLGSFAQDYRTMFGELPSGTVRRCRRV
jgi:AraC family ethanolamine operon transcriptional activator